ncbi:MAG: Trk family potassium uptake protein [Clostridia bacterium]|nr:Trk family potassium uptake protein [Clostridia bacterium]
MSGLRIRGTRLTAFQVIAAGFILLILAGTLLLMIPAASRADGSAPFRDCAFTAVSAVCVTGLVVVDTARAWTPLGQAIILLLIQTGGMGIVTTAASFAFLSGKKLGLAQRGILQESISAPQLGGIVQLTRFIIAATAAIELAGALLLMIPFIPRFGVWKGIWLAVFHAVSAFCNAGFDLMGSEKAYSSLTADAFSVPVNLTVMLLITVGGIGFLVWDDIRRNKLSWKKYRLQTKVVLVTSGLLVLIPALIFFLTEMPELPPEKRILPSLFQSVTLRTAGFNTVDLNAFSDSGKGVMILGMLVGGSPGSTAGGMKTTTLAVLLLSARAVIRRRPDAASHGRRIEDGTVLHASALLMLYLLLFLFCGMAISRIESLPLSDCLFETASAIGTVGLSMGITPGLGTASRVLLMFLMFFGRVGGLTLLYAAQPAQKPGTGRLPAEKMIVG